MREFVAEKIGMFITEPFPLKPAPLSRMSFKKEELANVTPEHTKACEDLFTRFPTTHNDGPFTRYGLQPSVVFPGTWGGSNYQGGTYDPTTPVLIALSNPITDAATWGSLETITVPLLNVLPAGATYQRGQVLLKVVLPSSNSPGAGIEIWGCAWSA